MKSKSTSTTSEPTTSGLSKQGTERALSIVLRACEDVLWLLKLSELTEEDLRPLNEALYSVYQTLEEYGSWLRQQ